jgi:hypothetical protein
VPHRSHYCASLIKHLLADLQRDFRQIGNEEEFSSNSLGLPQCLLLSDLSPLCTRCALNESIARRPDQLSYAQVGPEIYHKRVTRIVTRLTRTFLIGPRWCVIGDKSVCDSLSVFLERTRGEFVLNLTLPYQCCRKAPLVRTGSLGKQFGGLAPPRLPKNICFLFAHAVW